MRNGCRLRPLGVSVDGEDGFAMTCRKGQQRTAQIERGGEKIEDALALAHAVHRHIDIVAAARGVQAAGDILAASGGYQTLDMEEEVFASAVVGRHADVFLRDGI